MRKSHKTLAILSLTSMLFLQSEANATNVRTLCYKISVGANTAYVRGDVFRQGLLELTRDKWKATQVLSPARPPIDPQKCTGASTTPLGGPDDTNYLGNITNKQKFLRMAKTACGGGAAIADQYFSIGDAIYYRNCNPGNQTGYIHFWGKPDSKSSQCFGSTYPEMFSVASANRTAVTPSKLQAIYNNTGSPPMASQSDYAIGNAMAAIQIAETVRDYLVYPINYMLIDQQTAAERVIGGHCPSNPPANTCQNRTDSSNGAHPIAWGGALTAMMTGGGWGTSNGATSDYGMEFEAAATVNWLLYKKLVERERIPVNTVSSCPVVQQFGNLPANVQDVIENFFSPVFN